MYIEILWHTLLHLDQQQQQPTFAVYTEINRP